MPPSGGTCSFDITVQIPATATAGTFVNTTSNLQQSGLQVGIPATANLEIEPAPTFSKDFAPATVGLNGANTVSTLTFTIDNTASSLAATALNFTDNLPAGMEISSPSNASTTCTGGTLTAVSGTSIISYTGATVAATASCTVQVDVISTSTGNKANTSGDLTSSSGNSGTASDTLLVDAPPSIAAPADINIEATATNTPVTLGTPVITDDVDVGLSATSDSPASFPVGDTTVTWTVTDSIGNTSTATQTVTITDNTAPVVTAPGDITQEATGTLTSVVLGSASVVEVVDTALAATPSTTGPFPLGTTTVTWTATDTAGNIGTATQTVTIVDSTDPVVTAPGDITQEATGTTTAVVIGTAIATDLVDGTRVATADTAGPFPIGPTIVTWTATDLTGNSGADTQTITIVDTTAPVVSVTGANPLTLNTGDTFTDPGATASDLVDGNVTANISAAGTVNTAVPATYTITYSVTDNAGNTGSNTRSVIVNDGTPPVVTAPTNISQEATGTNTAVALGNATVTDDVDTGLTATPSSTGPFPLGTTTVTWTATDAAGNIGSAAQTVTIVDTTLPVVTPPTAINQQATGATTAVNLGSATVSDAVSTALVATPDITGPFGLGSTLVTWSATDAAGNSGTATQTVTIIDTTAPVVTVIGSASITLKSGAAYADQGATANDLVDGNISASIVTSNPVNTAIPATYTVTYSATDQAGNTGTNTRTVIVNDSDAPNVTAPTNINQEASGATTVVSLGTATVSDNIDTGLTATPSDTGPFPVGTTTVIWSATDSTGNVGSAAQTVTIVDSTPPVLSLIGADPITFNVGATIVDPGATASDLVDGDLTTSIVVTNPVDTNLAASYTVVYSSTDNAGNTATTSRTVNVQMIPTTRCFNGPLASGQTGTLCFTSTDTSCTFNGNPVFSNVASVTPPPPENLSFIDGLLSFEINNCSTGSTVDIAMDYGQAIPATTVFWKAGTPWFPLSSTVAGNIISFQITDGGLGDADGIANGTIRDPGGAAIAAIIPPVAPSTTPIPTLSQWALLLLSILMLSLLFIQQRKIS